MDITLERKKIAIRTKQKAISENGRIFTQREPSLMPPNEENQAQELSQVEPKSFHTNSCQEVYVIMCQTPGTGPVRNGMGEDTLL